MSYDASAIILKLADAELTNGEPLFPELRLENPHDSLAHSYCDGGRCIVPHRGNCRGRGWVPETDPERAAYRVSVVLHRKAASLVFTLHHGNGTSVWFDTDGMHETRDPIEADLRGALAWAQKRKNSEKENSCA